MKTGVIYPNEKSVLKAMAENGTLKVELFNTAYVDPNDNYQKWGFSVNNVNSDYYLKQKSISSKTTKFELTNVKVLSVDKYNEMRTKDWNKKYDEVLSEVNKGNRHLTELPQLAFFLMHSDVHYGYVAFNDSKAIWAKSKKEAVKKLTQF